MPYDNIKINRNASDVQSNTPRAIISIFPFKQRVIFPSSSSAKHPKQPEYKEYLETKTPIVLTSEILNLNISNSKKGISFALNATLIPNIDFLESISPGDYIMAWIMNDAESFDKTLEAVLKPAPANDFDSGLKFLGQIFTIQETYVTNPNGMKQLRYTISATGFNQYNSQIFYSPFVYPGDDTLAGSFLRNAEFFSNIGDANKAFTAKAYDVQEQFLFYHTAFLGPGPGTFLTGKFPRRTVNGTFGVPEVMTKLLGRKEKKDSQYTISDMMSVIVGIQNYSKSKPGGKLGPDVIPRGNFKNKGGTTYGVVYETDHRLVGRKLANIPPTMNSSILSILQQHSNSILNEMYFCLRPEPTDSNAIVPTLICRQVPFSTKAIKSNPKAPVTFFKDITRFEINSDLIVSYSLNKSESMRTNSYFVMWEDPVGTVGNTSLLTQGLMVNAGIWFYDSHDILRHGMKLFKGTVSSAVLDLGKGSADAKPLTSTSAQLKLYNELIADWMTNMHLRYTGTMQTVGIQEPITIGENLQWNNLVFHIEAVTHSYVIDGKGIPVFRTNLELSHGTYLSKDKTELEVLNDQLIDLKDPVADANMGVFSEIAGRTVKENER